MVVFTRKSKNECDDMINDYLSSEGVSGVRIAKKHNISERQFWRILKKHRENQSETSKWIADINGSDKTNVNKSMNNVTKREHKLERKKKISEDRAKSDYKSKLKSKSKNKRGGGGGYKTPLHEPSHLSSSKNNDKYKNGEKYKNSEKCKLF